MRKDADPDISGSVDSAGSIDCLGQSKLIEADKSFTKEDLCRDHGNGLEIVCVEKLYQDAVGELPKPDLVAMFSPGFPQLARATWDPVLRSLLDSGVPIMVGDLLSTDKHFCDAQNDLPSPGSDLLVTWDTPEAGMTLNAMDAFEAHQLGSKRGPFPLVIPQGGSEEYIAKNAVLQVFQGRKKGAEAFEVPSAELMKTRKATVEEAHIQQYMEDNGSAKELIQSLLSPMSAQYLKAMWQMYRNSVTDVYIKKEYQLSKEDQNTAQEMGLGGKSRETPWTFEEWLFVLTKLGFGDDVFF
jgi:hypothetical protein